jgi:hypothetical protein
MNHARTVNRIQIAEPRKKMPKPKSMVTVTPEHLDNGLQWGPPLALDKSISAMPVNTTMKAAVRMIVSPIDFALLEIPRSSLHKCPTHVHDRRYSLVARILIITSPGH